MAFVPRTGCAVRRWGSAILLACASGCSPAVVRAPATIATPAPADTTVHTQSETPRSEHGVRSFVGPPAGPLPQRLDDRGVVWVRGDTQPMPSLGELRTRPEALPRDSLVAWTIASWSTPLRPYAFRPIARLKLALADTAGADSALAALADPPGPWRSEALVTRADLAMARDDTTGAERFLESVARDAWNPRERADGLGRLVVLRAARTDTESAVALARQLIRRFPSMPAAPVALIALESLLASRRDSLTVGDLRAAAEVDVARRTPTTALHRLEAAWVRDSSASRWEIGVRKAELERSLKRYADARLTLRDAAGAAVTGPARARVALERARIDRDAGVTARAIAEYGRVTATADSSQRAIAAWERAQIFESLGRWLQAEGAYRRAAEAGGRRRDSATLRSALMAIAGGHPAAAARGLEGGPSDAFLFWRGVAARRVDRATGDSLLRMTAEMPGYAFYRVAARETLGVRGWPPGAIGGGSRTADLDLVLAYQLGNLGLGDEAVAVLDHWLATDSLVGDPHGDGTRADLVLGAAAIAYQANRPRAAIRYVERALALIPDSTIDLRWSLTPWLYPPAFDSLFAAYPESAAADEPDRALLQAVAWKESHFDPTARSRSDALGLLQLKRAAVTDVARWFHEAVPSDSALFDPALNLRYGARYLTQMLRRFPGNLPLALAAYNAGPGTARQWTRLRAIGGDALACEEVDRPETQDYVKTILAVRQAYRELRPRIGSP